ncbi:MAG: 2-hydroxyacyl-CoA dehydratase family protein [Actinomycetota bacterium]|nr:2-hydroxyacyl-CoA dehydratase family protein [Actinomycetota bacterium]
MQLEFKPEGGLFQRVENLVKVALDLPYGMSDEELEGVVDFLSPDTAHFIEGIMNPRFRDEGLAFMKMIGEWMLEARQAREDGRKVVLVPFNFPPEVIHIFKKAVPLTSEVLSTIGVVALEGQGERYWDHAMGMGIPDYLCSSSTIELGSVLTGNDFEPDIIVQSAPGACDANSKIHEFVALHMDIPQVFLERPVEVTSRGREVYRRFFLGFIRQLEELLDEELDEEHMREVLEGANSASGLYYDLYDLRKFSPCPVPNIFNIFTYGVRFTVWGKPRAILFLERMIDAARRRLENGDYPAEQEVARCMWLYVGYYFDILGFFNWMEEHGITYLNDVLSLIRPQFIDTASKESMLMTLADVCFDYPMTRQMGADSMSLAWIDDMSRAIQELDANCAIYSGHHACKQTWSVISKVRSEITGRTGAPVLCLQGDAWIRRMTPISVLQEEISSFVDNVLYKKRRKSRRKNSAQKSGPDQPPSGELM